jgi:hypothetical protein
MVMAVEMLAMAVDQVQLILVAVLVQVDLAQKSAVRD